jgi:hypothetical protein
VQGRAAMEDQLSSIILVVGACLVTVLFLALVVAETGDADEGDW